MIRNIVFAESLFREVPNTRPVERACSAAFPLREIKELTECVRLENVFRRFYYQLPNCCW